MTQSNFTKSQDFDFNGFYIEVNYFGTVTFEHGDYSTPDNVETEIEIVSIFVFPESMNGNYFELPNYCETLFNISKENIDNWDGSPEWEEAYYEAKY